MKIDRARLREIPLRLKEYFEISSGGKQDRRILLLTLEGEGFEAWGECVVGEDPGYSYETTETAWHMLTDFILPAVVGRDADGPEDVLAPVRWIRGHRMAKAAVEMAAWDLAARMEGVSLSKKLGGTRSAVPVGVSVGLQKTDEELHEKVAGYVEAGYARVKIKIKPGRVGGHASSKRIHDAMVSHGLPVWCGGMLESGVGRAHNVALASLPGFTLPGDISASRRYWERDIVTPEFEVSNGEMRVPTGPGIGVEPDQDRIAALTVREAAFG